MERPESYRQTALFPTRISCFRCQRRAVLVPEGPPRRLSASILLGTPEVCAGRSVRHTVGTTGCDPASGSSSAARDPLASSRGPAVLTAGVGFLYNVNVCGVRKNSHRFRSRTGAGQIVSPAASSAAWNSDIFTGVHASASMRARSSSAGTRLRVRKCSSPTVRRRGKIS